MLKKFLWNLVLCLGIGTLSGCQSTQQTSQTNDRIQIVTNIFPIYDWTKAIVGDSDTIEVTLLMENGTDLHSFQPSFEDIRKVTDSDLFIYIVGQSDTWAADAVAQKTNENMVALDLIAYLADDVTMEEEVEGMTAEEEEEEEYDEHVWLSLTRAVKMTRGISDAICAIDPSHAETYQANAADYIAQLENLHQSYQEMVAAASYQTLLFADRFPFLYLTKDYNLNYYAAFPGCSQDTNASFETVVFLTEKVDTLQLPAVLILENNRTELAETIVSSSANKDAKILTLDSMQSTKKSDIEEGASYLSIMEENLKVLTLALNKSE